MIPLLEPFMRIFNHHNGGIHHCAHGDGDPTQRHNIGVQPLEVHDDKGNAQAERQRNDGDQRRADVPEEQGADNSHHDKLFKQLGTQIVDCPVD